MVDLIVTDRASIERGIVVKSPYIVVSIHDPDKPRPRIPARVGLRDVIYVAFHDAEPVEELDLPSDVVLMTADNARQIWEFVRRHIDYVGAIVCQCEQGMSRSPAVALALSELLGVSGDVFRSNYQPNLYVMQQIRLFGRNSWPIS